MTAAPDQTLNLEVRTEGSQHRLVRRGMGSHQSAAMMKDEWLTPKEIIQALGPFDLDPCSPIVRPWPTATQHYTVEDDGLSKQWHGRVWLNPPYGQHTSVWMERLALHGTGTALIFARTETDTWHTWVWPRATSILFIRGRLYFHHVSGKQVKHNAGAPSALIAYGQDDAAKLKASGIAGATCTTNEPTEPQRPEAPARNQRKKQ